MAISTDTLDLIKYYEDKKSNDKKQKEQIESTRVGYTIQQGNGQPDIKVWGVIELIDKFDKSIECIDTKIIKINDQIKNLQASVLSIGQSANSVGCGTAGVGIGTSVYQDNLKYIGWSFNGNNPFQQESGNLNNSNAGVGTYTYVNPVSIGTYYPPIDTCYNIITCTTELCVGYATSIVNITNQINILKSDRDDLIIKVNNLKKRRSSFELQDWAYKRTKQKLNDDIEDSEEAIQFLSTDDDDCL